MHQNILKTECPVPFGTNKTYERGLKQ